jgi:hypothetical protein
MSNSKIPRGSVYWICSDKAYDRIVAAVADASAGRTRRSRRVGKEPTARNKLVSGLEQAYSQLLLFKALDSDNGAKARGKLFGGIVKDAIYLQTRLLAHNEYAARALIPDEPRRHAFLGELDRIVDGAKASKEQNSKGGWVRLERSLLEWFAAEKLPEVYEKNFGGKKVWASNNGPGVRFINAVMREMGLRIISTGTLARALKDVRKGRPRRKKRPSTLPRPQNRVSNPTEASIGHVSTQQFKTE